VSGAGRLKDPQYVYLHLAPRIRCSGLVNSPLLAQLAAHHGLLASMLVFIRLRVLTD